MKILFFSRLFHPHVGGVERHVAGLSRELIKHGHQITVITEKYLPTLKDEEMVDGIKIYRIKANSKLTVWGEISKLSKIINQAEIIHIHDVFWWFLPYFYKKYFITFHGYEGSDLPRWQAKLERKIAERLASGSVCVGDFMKKWYYASPTMVTYGAASLEPMPIKGNNAAYWGRLDEDAGILIYARALPLVNKTIKLAVYGDGKQRNNLIKFNNSNIQINDWTDDIRAVLAGCRYAFVSRYLSILEAMQAKRLVLAVYNNAIKKDYLSCHPMAKNMIMADSAETLANKLNELTEIQEKEMVTAAFTWATKQTWEKLAKEYRYLWQVQ